RERYMGLLHWVYEDEVRRLRRTLELYLRCELESKPAHETRVTLDIPLEHTEGNIGGN
ncbi:unnamed protein product, partial [marine sediment metagenome]